MRPFSTGKLALWQALAVAVERERFVGTTTDVTKELRRQTFGGLVIVRVHVLFGSWTMDGVGVEEKTTKEMRTATQEDAWHSTAERVDELKQDVMEGVTQEPAHLP
ncbi:hypothetical protein TIFTF001_018725 [Ficus carica]|uniref:Uncharacterized protein n=1 Tax=Ficus carica TaxID=3494 RepID=A0AA88DJ99_FICCA|nr:hypothetical protein TIFTF001_018725 [Ficus carica]